MRFAAASIGLLLVVGISASAHAQTSASADCGDRGSISDFLARPKPERDRILGCVLAQAAIETSKDLPKKTDDITTLERIDAKGTTLSYYYSIALLRSEVPATALAGLTDDVRGKVCATAPMQQTISWGGSYHYVWKDKAGETMTELTVASC